MTATRTSSNGSATDRDLLDRVEPRRPRPRRNWPRVGAAAGLAVACGAFFVLLYGSAGSRHPVLAIAHPVAADQPITASDLTTVRVADDPRLDPVPADQAAAVIGRQAAVALVPGTLLVPGDLMSGPVVGSGFATVGLSLKPGQVPSELVPGDIVMVVASPTPGQAPPGAGNSAVLVDRATVLSVAFPSAASGSSNTEVTLIVPTALAPGLAQAAAAGQAAVVGLGAGGS